MADLFVMSKEERQRYCATLMGLNPNDRASWPMEWIDGALSAAEIEAHRWLHQHVDRAVRKQ